MRQCIYEYTRGRRHADYRLSSSLYADSIKTVRNNLEAARVAQGVA
jgi:hypothetical protein